MPSQEHGVKVDTRTQVRVSIEESVYQAASKHAYSIKSSFSEIVQAALAAYLLSKGKK